ncbi:MAG TPA: hypothetical protein VF807_03845 [Ktedonobacterales bacterium]
MSEMEQAPAPDDMAGDANVEAAEAGPSEAEAEGATPPGYDWPTNGGYLGCLMGLILACVVAGFLGANFFSFIYIAANQSTLVFVLINVVVFALVAAGLGRLGWLLGKRFYRYYPQPEPSWGEDDAAPSRSVFAGAKGVTAGAADDEETPDESGISAEGTPPPTAGPTPRASASSPAMAQQADTDAHDEDVTPYQPVAPLEPIKSADDGQQPA